MDYEEFWLALSLRKPDLAQTTHALAVFACAYVELDSLQIKDYSPFINNYGN